jgi:hypothetical protein
VHRKRSPSNKDPTPTPCWHNRTGKSDYFFGALCRDSNYYLPLFFSARMNTARLHGGE